jgi:hypothetical protein
MMPHRERAAYKEWVKGLSSKAGRPAKCLRAGTISAGSKGPRRGSRAVELPAYCRHPAPAHAFRCQRLRVGTIRRRTEPVCHQARRPAGLWWSLPEPARRVPHPAASARNRSRSRAMAARSGPGSDRTRRGLCGSLTGGRHQDTREIVRDLFPCRKTARGHGCSPANSPQCCFDAF